MTVTIINNISINLMGPEYMYGTIFPPEYVACMNNQSSFTFIGPDIDTSVYTDIGLNTATQTLIRTLFFPGIYSTLMDPSKVTALWSAPFGKLYSIVHTKIVTNTAVFHNVGDTLILYIHLIGYDQTPIAVGGYLKLSLSIGGQYSAEYNTTPTIMLLEQYTSMCHTITANIDTWKSNWILTGDNTSIIQSYQSDVWKLVEISVYCTVGNTDYNLAVRDAGLVRVSTLKTIFISTRSKITSFQQDHPSQLLEYWNNQTFYQTTVVSDISATRFIRQGGTSDQFLKGDGTMDTNKYALVGTTGVVQGPKGDTGPQGIQGVAGGTQGVAGLKGTTGTTGLKGDTGLQGTTGTIGTTGIQGLKGDTGTQGLKGLKGDTGLKGTTTDVSNYLTITAAANTYVLYSDITNEIVNYTDTILVKFRADNSWYWAGQPWTDRTTADFSYYSVCWSAELNLLVAVAYNGSNSIATSSNGITWVSKSVTYNARWRSVCWSAEKNLFIAVAHNDSGTTPNCSTRSTDGTLWVASKEPYATYWTCIIWAKELGLFVAVGDMGGNRVTTTVDGITWISRTPDTTNNSSSWNSVCWAKELGLLVAVGSGQNRVMTSGNGITWPINIATGVPLNPWTSVCWSPELQLLVAVASSGTNQVMTSRNGINWTARPASNEVDVPTVATWSSVCWAAELGLFAAVAVNSPTDLVMTSPDGIIWTGRQQANRNYWCSICWAKELFMLVTCAHEGTNHIMTSP
jgi:hypothetical protein